MQRHPASAAIDAARNAHDEILDIADAARHEAMAREADGISRIQPARAPDATFLLRA
ncbi:MAG: hypothetical protein AAGJ54_06680 [Planctomycetota bacterium]